MRHPSEWFSTEPDIDEDTARPRRWYHRSAEIEGGPEARLRLNLGDITAESEHENGEPSGAAFTVDIRLWEDTGQFDYDNRNRWHDHSVLVVVWRWGVYLAWRGGRKAGR